MRTDMDEHEEAKAPLRDDSNSRAFDAFYQIHYDRTYRALGLATRNIDLAREATDEAMTRAFQRWDTIGGYDAPEQWVFRVGLNWAISQQRRKRFEPSPILVEPSVEDGLPEPEVAEAIAELPIKMRAVVVARLYLDWSTETTSRALAIPEGTVKSRLKRAIKRLERRLDNQ